MATQARTWPTPATCRDCSGDMPPEELTTHPQAAGRGHQAAQVRQGHRHGHRRRDGRDGAKGRRGVGQVGVTKTIVDGTGATGPALKRLQADFQAVAKHGAARAATGKAIADLNTHLGLTGPLDLQRVADLALKASIDTSKFGAVAEQTGRDVDGYAELLNDLTAAGMAGPAYLPINCSTRSGRTRRGGRPAGGDIEGLIAHVTELANEFGPTGLRGAMSETMAEVDTGVIPTVTSLRDQFGDTSTVIEDARDAAYTWRDAMTRGCLGGRGHRLSRPGRRHARGRRFDGCWARPPGVPLRDASKTAVVQRAGPEPRHEA